MIFMQGMIAIRIALCIIDNLYLIRVVDSCTYLVVNSAAMYVLLIK
jgi:hypothetical protein